jgi:hypothetical protein
VMPVVHNTIDEGSVVRLVLVLGREVMVGRMGPAHGRVIGLNMKFKYREMMRGELRISLASLWMHIQYGNYCAFIGRMSPESP